MIHTFILNSYQLIQQMKYGKYCSEHKTCIKQKTETPYEVSVLSELFKSLKDLFLRNNINNNGTIIEAFFGIFICKRHSVYIFTKSCYFKSDIVSS